MRIDNYTKGVLTIIAIALVWIAAGGPSLVPVVEAQNDTRALIVGWVDRSGATHQLPRPFHPETAAGVGQGLPVNDEQARRPAELRRP